MTTAIPAPMTDLGRLLSGPQAPEHMVRLLRTLEDERLKVHRKMSAGLNQDDYAHASRRVAALDSAQLVLKSLNIYLSR